MLYKLFVKGQINNDLSYTTLEQAIQHAKDLCKIQGREIIVLKAVAHVQPAEPVVLSWGPNE